MTDRPNGSTAIDSRRILRTAWEFRWPSVNSYRRIRPHCWSGAFRCWVFDNREAAIRVPTFPEPPTPTHIELKTVDASANPYLALGAAIADLETDIVLLEALGSDLATAYLAVRRMEWEAMKAWDLEKEVELLVDRY